MSLLARQLPPEPAADPVNSMLDLAEAAIRTCCEHGGEDALRTRLARLLPPPAAPVIEVVTGDPMELQAVLSALRDAGRLRMDAHSSDLNRRARSLVTAWLDAANRNQGNAA